MNNNELVSKLTKDANKLQNKIQYRKFYNIRNLLVKSLLKSGIALDYALPFIAATIIIGWAKTASGDAPFRIDEIEEPAEIEMIDTSSGIHIEHISYDFSYEDELIEYSTGWIKNDKGLYERTVTSYRLNDELDLSDTEKIMSMSKEEIDQALVITNIKTIKKNTLNPEDIIYDKDATIVVNHYESLDETITRLETSGENIWNSIYYIVLSLCWGNNFKSIGNLFIKTYIRDKLEEYVPLFRPITKEELETMKKILKVKQENLAMINGESNNFETREGHSYRLRKL